MAFAAWWAAKPPNAPVGLLSDIEITTRHTSKVILPRLFGGQEFGNHTNKEVRAGRQATSVASGPSHNTTG